MPKWPGSVLLALGVFGAACGAEAEGGEGVIAALLPFTGPDSAGSYNLERAILSVIEQVNDTGGLSGRRVRLESRDTRSSVEGTAGALEALSGLEPMALLGVESVEGSPLALEFARERMIPFISPFVSSRGGEAVEAARWWRFAPSPGVLGESIATEIFRGGRRAIDVVRGGGEYHAEFASALERRFTTLGGRVKVSLQITSGQASYADEAAALGLDSEDAVVVLAEYPASAARFVNEVDVYRQGRPVTWWLSPVLQSREFLQNTLPRAVEGARGVVPGVVRGGPEFVDAFQTRWRGDPPARGAFYYYDAVSTLVLALEQRRVAAEAYVGPDALRPAETEFLNEAFEQLTSGSGEQVNWADLRSGLEKIRAGRLVFYQGLTGPISWTSGGERTFHLFSAWSIQKGDIAVTE